MAMASDNNLLPSTKTVTKIKTRKLIISKNGHIESLKMLLTKKKGKGRFVQRVFLLEE
jgi:hypothetical protein